MHCFQSYLHISHFRKKIIIKKHLSLQNRTIISRVIPINFLHSKGPEQKYVKSKF